MAKNTLAVYDSCQAYIERFLSYAHLKKNLTFEIVGFTETDILMDYLAGNEVSAVLLSPNTADKNFGEIIKHLASLGNCSDQVVIFLGERQEADRISEQLKNEIGERRIRFIDKYQSIENILLEAETVIAEQAPGPKGYKQKNLKLAGIYDPVQKISHPGMAYAIAKKIMGSDRWNGKARVLYINLEQFPGKDKWLDYPKNTGISDVIYFYRTNPARVAEALNKARGSYNGMDVLTAPTHFEDLEELRREEWPDFLSALFEAGDYLMIVIDLYVLKKVLIDVIFEYGNLYIPALPYSENKTYRSVLNHKNDRAMQDEQTAMEKMREFRQFIKDGWEQDQMKKILEVELDSD